MASLETIAGDGVSRLLDGVGRSASFQRPSYMAIDKSKGQSTHLVAAVRRQTVDVASGH